jgi:regulatory protein
LFDRTVVFEMAGEISALVFQKRNKERVNVYLDGRYAFSLPAIEAAQLHRGQYLSDAEIGALREKGELQKGYDRALRFLAYRPRSRAEVEEYLAGKGVIPAHVAEILERLAKTAWPTRPTI